MDCDEYYRTNEFANAKKYVLDNGLDTSACNMYTYYKKPTLRISPNEKYYVPFICRVTSKEVGTSFPVPVDPTRGVAPRGKFSIIPNELCMMHHFSYVRKDISRKLRNSSASVNWAKQIDNRVAEFENWKVGDKITPFQGHATIEVDNEFNIGI
jgi:hypothetical protein